MEKSVLLLSNRHKTAVMTLSRRSFLESALALTGTTLLSPAMLGSCSLLGREQGSEMDYIGTREGYERYLEYFRRTGVSSLNFHKLEESLTDGIGLAMIDFSSPTKPAYILMLMEQGKDILTTYPLGYSLSEYSNISGFMEKYGRFVGIMDPLAQYPSLAGLSDRITRAGISLNRVGIRCHPRNLVEGFPVAGFTGPAQNMERAVSRVCKAYPMGYLAEPDSEGNLSRIRISYRDFPAEIDLDPGQTGWRMKFEGRDFRAELDHTGMLALDQEVEPRFAPDPRILRKSIRLTVKDFLSAAYDRSEPAVNHLDGLASIIMNVAVEESLRTGREVSR